MRRLGQVCRKCCCIWCICEGQAVGAVIGTAIYDVKQREPIPYEFVEELGTPFDGIRLCAKTTPDAKLALPNRHKGKQ